MEDNKSTRITFGSALAMVISYTTWKSVGWAIFHGLLSWVYVIYFLLRYYLLFEKYNGVGHQKFMVNLVMNFLTM